MVHFDWKFRNFLNILAYPGYAIFTSLLPALGVPTRSVTNFESAHDTDGTMTIDAYVASDQSELKHFPSDDSVWNFHVWNEVWVKARVAKIFEICIFLKKIFGQTWKFWSKIEVLVKNRKFGQKATFWSKIEHSVKNKFWILPPLSVVEQCTVYTRFRIESGGL